jgi:hypothetical protein
MDFVTTGTTISETEQVDWNDLKAKVMAGLDVVAEYRKLGLRIASEANPSTGKIQAHAMGRNDDNPSAFISTRTGVYHAHGDPPETLSFWDFALKYGAFGEWSEMIRHYAARADVVVPKFRKTGKGWIQEAVYPYRTRDGDLVFEVIRYRQQNGKKTFRQRRPGPRSGEWIYDLNGTRRVLYKLPEMHAAKDATVWLVEGEKDVDAIVERGLVAVCSPQGAEAAGRKFWEEGLYTDDLAGRDVVIVPDNDQAGKWFASLVAHTIHERAKRVRVLELPAIHPKGDVSDWFEIGHTTADLVALADAAEDFNPETAAKDDDLDPNRDAHAGDLVAANAGTRWLWEGWLPLSVLTLLTAEPSTGKTRFCLDLTKRIAAGTQWPDGTPLAVPDGLTNRVLWIAADNQHAELADAPAKFGFEPESLRLNTTVGDIYAGTELQTPEQVDDLENRIKRLRPALVIIDTVTNTSDFKSQDTSDAKRQYKPLQEVAKRTGTCIVCVTHLNVAGKTLGRRADEKTRVTIRLEKPDPERQPNRRKLSVALSRLSVYPPALGVTMGDDGNTYDTTPPEAPEPGGGGGGGNGVQGTPGHVRRAADWLAVRLAMGPVRVSVIRNEAEDADPAINPNSLYKARDLLGVEEYEQQNRKWWRLTENGQPHDDNHDAPPF